jgi:hypothetical protein
VAPAVGALTALAVAAQYVLNSVKEFRFHKLRVLALVLDPLVADHP